MFAFLALAVSAGSRVVTGNEIAIVALTISWMSAAITRLGELRRGERPAVRLDSLDSRTTAILIAGTGPWVLLGVLQRVSQSFVWPPVEMGPELRAIGVMLAIAVIAEPFLPVRRTETAAARDPYQFSESVMIRSLAILLLSGSPLFALVCVLWLGVTVFHPTDPGASADPRMPVLREAH